MQTVKSFTADYFQILIRDSKSKSDLSDWADGDLRSGFLRSDDAISISTPTDGIIEVVIELVSDKSEIDLAEGAISVDQTISIPSGKLLISGVSDYEPTISPIVVAPGPYNVVAQFIGFDSIVESEDYRGRCKLYLVQI